MNKNFIIANFGHPVSKSCLAKTLVEINEISKSTLYIWIEQNESSLAFVPMFSITVFFHIAPYLLKVVAGIDLNGSFRDICSRTCDFATRC